MGKIKYPKYPEVDINLYKKIIDPSWANEKIDYVVTVSTEKDGQLYSAQSTKRNDEVAASIGAFKHLLLNMSKGINASVEYSKFPLYIKGIDHDKAVKRRMFYFEKAVEDAALEHKRKIEEIINPLFDWFEEQEPMATKCCNSVNYSVTDKGDYCHECNTVKRDNLQKWER